MTREAPARHPLDASSADADASAETSATACDTSAHPTLEDYSEVREGAAFSLLVRRETSGAWVPVQPLRMPMHHASALVFEPPLDSLVPEPRRAQPVLVIATGLGRRSLEHDPRRRAWFATYAARVERACPALLP
jgi:hypothetical protein